MAGRKLRRIVKTKRIDERERRVKSPKDRRGLTGESEGNRER